MTLVNAVMDNWEAIMASILVLIAAADKVFDMAIKTIGNIRDSWQSTFPKKIKDDPPLS